MNRVALVLDAAALVRYAHLDLDVGETLGEVFDEDGAFAGLPALAVADARLRLSDSDDVARLERLVDNESVAVLPLRAEDAFPLAEYAAHLDHRLALAHAVLETDAHDAQILTGQADLVLSAYPDLNLIALD